MDLEVAVVEAAGASCSVTLLGTFEIRMGPRRLDLPRGSERLVAYLALQPSRMARDRVAAVLWPDSPEQRSLGCLRSALWRVRAECRPLIHPDNARLGLAPDTTIDARVLVHQARRAADADWSTTSVRATPEAFGAELLPGWDEEWVLFERERLREVALCGLEALSRGYLAAGAVLEAVEAAWRAISLEPLRESAHHALIDAHLAQGNVGEAVRGLRSLESTLRRELGIAPDPDLVRRVGSAVAGRRLGTHYAASAGPLGVSSVLATPLDSAQPPRDQLQHQVGVRGKL